MNNDELIRRIGRIRVIFTENFENPWLFSLMEGIPLDPVLLKEIRGFLRLNEEWAVDEAIAREGVANLQLFVHTLRQYLLPCLREKLRISHLKPETLINDRDQRAIRALVAYAVPIKVTLLEEQVQEFSRDLDQASEPMTALTALTGA